MHFGRAVVIAVLQQEIHRTPANGEIEEIIQMMSTIVRTQFRI